jgi:hypothetical protein
MFESVKTRDVMQKAFLQVNCNFKHLAKAFTIHFYLQWKIFCVGFEAPADVTVKSTFFCSGLMPCSSDNLLPASAGFLLWLLRMEATYSSKMSRFLRTTGRYIPENRTFQNC